MCGRLRGVWARARWRVWVLGNSTIILRKAVRRENFAKDVKFSDCRKSIRKQIRPSCRKIFRPYFVFQVFGFVKATKFIDSSEFSVCVQNVLSKSCLPCRCWYWTKKNCRARKGEGRKERDVFNTGHSKLPFASNLNRVFVGNVYLENEFDLHENYVIKCEDTYSTSICVNAFSFPYLLDLLYTVKQYGGFLPMPVLFLFPNAFPLDISIKTRWAKCFSTCLCGGRSNYRLRSFPSIALRIPTAQSFTRD